MKLKGKVLKRFNDKNTNILYEPKTDYKDADIYEAEKQRYEELFYKGYVEKGELVENNNRFKTEKLK